MPLSLTSEQSIPSKMVFSHLEDKIYAKRVIDMEWVYSVVPMPNAHEMVMENLQSTMPFMVHGTQPQTEDLPREDVIGHIESKSYMVFGKSNDPEVGAQALYLKDNTEVMNQIKTYIQDNQDVETMSIVWMEVEGLSNGGAIYSIEWA